MPRIAGIVSTPSKSKSNFNAIKAKEYLEKLKNDVGQQEKGIIEDDKNHQIPEEKPELDIGETVKESKSSFAELKKLFGMGFTQPEYQEMNDRLLELANNYPMERTAMHKEALVTYVKYAFKRDKAIAEDDIDAADKWGKLAAKQANDAKINPNQLSAADLSDGINNFSKISEAVEREQDIIPILPHFKQQPQDVVDYTLWQFVNYIRRLQNLPTVTYAEIYKFMDEMYEKNKGSLKFLKRESNGHYDDFAEDLENGS